MKPRLEHEGKEYDDAETMQGLVSSAPPPPILPKNLTPQVTPPRPPPKLKKSDSPPFLEEKPNLLEEITVTPDLPPLPPRPRTKSKTLRFANLEPLSDSDPESSADEVPFVAKENAFSDSNTVSVKDLAKSFNEIADTSELKLKDHAERREKKDEGGPGGLRRAVDARWLRQNSRNADGTLTTETKTWMLIIAKNDEVAMRKMMAADPGIVMSVDPWNSYSALHWMAKHGNLDMVKYLVDIVKMDPNARTKGGYTPLMLSAMYNRQDFTKLLLATLYKWSYGVYSFLELLFITSFSPTLDAIQVFEISVGEKLCNIWKKHLALKMTDLILKIFLTATGERQSKRLSGARRFSENWSTIRGERRESTRFTDTSINHEEKRI